MTDISNDQKRTKATELFLYYLLVYLQSGSNKENLEYQAKTIDEIGKGYFSSITNFVGYLNRNLDKLKDGEKNIWSRFLVTLPDNIVAIENYGTLNFKKEFQAISPFNDDDIVIRADYGNGFAMNQDDFQHYIDEELKNRDHSIYKYQKYTIIMEKPKIKEIIVQE